MDRGLEVAWSFGERVYGKSFAGMGYQEKVALTKDYLLYLIGEVDEVLRELDWKAHRLSGEPLSRNNLLEELVDIYKFWLGAMALWGFTEGEITAMFWHKTEVVEQRFVQERELSLTTKPIAIVDIDGVLADYPASFERFVARENVDDLSGRERARLKARYRDEGVEGAGVEPRKDAAEFMRALHGADYFTIALTSRPYARYKRLFGDTLIWFRRHKIPVDFIAFEEDKAAFILRLIDKGYMVGLAVDDDPRYVEKIAALGVKTFVPKNGDLLVHLLDSVIGGGGRS